MEANQRKHRNPKAHLHLAKTAQSRHIVIAAYRTNLRMRKTYAWDLGRPFSSPKTEQRNNLKRGRSRLLAKVLGESCRRGGFSCLRVNHARKPSSATVTTAYVGRTRLKKGMSQAPLHSADGDLPGFVAASIRHQESPRQMVAPLKSENRVV